MEKKTYNQLLFWAGIYALWVFAFSNYAFSLTKTMTVEFCYLIFIIAAFYVLDLWVMPQFLLKKKYLSFATATVFTLALAAGLRAFVALWMNLNIFHTNPQPTFFILYLNSVLNISIWALLFTVGKMMVDKINNQQQLMLLEKEKTKNELDFLKAQINPHALFNSLNTIYGHIDKNNKLARNTLLQFSELLRYQLYDCTSDKVNLDKEIAYIKNYIAFQQLRKNDNLIVDMSFKNNDPHLNIAPLLLIVVIENAFKFASSSCDKENKILIELFTEGGVLHFSILNTLEEQQPLLKTNANGIGIANLERRLALLYPNKYNFTHHKEKDFYKVNLNIELL